MKKAVLTILSFFCIFTISGCGNSQTESEINSDSTVQDTTVESYDFSDKTVIPFCTSGSSDIGRSDDNLKDLASGGNWLSGDRFDADVSESEIQEWISELN